MTGKSKIQMVDLRSQYLKIKEEVDAGIQEVIDTCSFINGPKVKEFQQSMEKYLGVNHVIPCANGTDALQIALMALDLQPGDEVIVPAFTYVATAEVIALLKLKPVMVDVDPDTFNLTGEIFEQAITPRTKAVVPVHLYGQSADMEVIMKIADKHGIYVVEDNAQAIGADYNLSTGQTQKTGTIGHIGCTSFYPSKNLGAYGDGGAIYSNDSELADKIRKIANHGQVQKYVHGLVGCNSRLDSIQAAILNVKLKHLDAYCQKRQDVADQYDIAFANVAELETPKRAPFSTHVFHQYTLKVKNGKRDELKAYLQERGVPTMIYYPIPLYKQEAYASASTTGMELPNTEDLCKEVISLPIHTEMDEEQQKYISKMVKEFFK